jgi:hypothetical protein
MYNQLVQYITIKYNTWTTENMRHVAVSRLVNFLALPVGLYITVKYHKHIRNVCFL